MTPENSQYDEVKKEETEPKTTENSKEDPDREMTQKKKKKTKRKKNETVYHLCFTCRKPVELI